MKEQFEQLFYQELSLMNLFSDCSNVAKLLGFCADPLAMILTYYEQGSLTNWIENKDASALPLGQIASFTADIISGLVEIHEKMVSNNDIKPDNVFIGQDELNRPRAHIGDFGIASMNDGRRSQVQQFKTIGVEGMTLMYAAPEILVRHLNPKLMEEPIQDCNILFKADIYAVGMSIFYMIARHRPWIEIEDGTQLAKSVLAGARPQIPEAIVAKHTGDLMFRRLVKTMDACSVQEWRLRPNSIDLKQLFHAK